MRKNESTPRILPLTPEKASAFAERAKRLATDLADVTCEIKDFNLEHPFLQGLDPVSHLNDAIDAAVKASEDLWLLVPAKPQLEATR